ncbi:MAG: GatB/YqeY domain-containing protein, partial [Methylophilaceae bacterium]
RMAKQRKDSLEVFTTQGRADLAQKEQEELDIIEQFLPKQLGADELKVILEKIIAEVGAAGPQDMGKVMGVATKQLAGQADGKVVSALVKELLAK